MDCVKRELAVFQSARSFNVLSNFSEVNKKIVMDGYPAAARTRNQAIIMRSFSMSLCGGFLDCTPLDRNTGGAAVDVDGLILCPGAGKYGQEWHYQQPKTEWRQVVNLGRDPGEHEETWRRCRALGFSCLLYGASPVS